MKPTTLGSPSNSTTGAQDGQSRQSKRRGREEPQPGPPPGDASADDARLTCDFDIFVKAVDSAGAKPIILLVEDDDGHAMLIEMHLRRAGVEAQFLRFRDGQEVLDFLHGGRGLPGNDPQRSYLVLLDICMPKLDGISVLRHLKGDPGMRHLPVIMLTTADHPEEIARCYELGCNGYLQKPVDLAAFAQAMDKLAKFIRLLALPRLENRSWGKEASY